MSEGRIEGSQDLASGVCQSACQRRKGTRQGEGNMPEKSVLEPKGLILDGFRSLYDTRVISRRQTIIIITSDQKNMI